MVDHSYENVVWVWSKPSIRSDRPLRTGAVARGSRCGRFWTWQWGAVWRLHVMRDAFVYLGPAEQY
jgi:hypothetical protein